MATKDVRIEVTATGLNLVTKGFNNAENSAKKMGNTGAKAGQKMARSFRSARSSLKGLGAAIGVVGVGAMVKKTLTLNEALGQLQVDANMSNEEILLMKKRMLEASSATGQMPSDMARAMKVFQDFGGVLDEGSGMMKELGTFATATGSDIGDTATIAATLTKTFKMGKGEVLDALVTIKKQADAANISMADASRVVPQILGVGKAYGFVGTRGVKQLLPALQIIGSLGMSAEESRSALNSMLTNLRQAVQAKTLKKEDVFDLKGNMKDIPDIMQNVMKRTGGDVNKMGKIFKDLGFKAAAAFQGAMKEKGGMKVFQATGERSDINAMFQKKKKSPVGGAALEAKQALAKASAAMHEYGGKMVSWVSSNPALAATLGIGGVIGAKAAPAIGKGIIGLIKRKRGGKGGLGDLLGGGGGAGGAQKVFVTNMPSGFGGGAGGANDKLKKAGDAAGKTGKTVSKLGKIASAAGKALGVLAVSYEVMSAIDDATGLSTWIAKKAAEGDKFDPVARAKKVEAKERTEHIQKRAVTDQARVFARMNAEGRTSVGLRGGGRMQLEQGAVMKELIKQAEAQGLSIGQIAELIPELQKLTSTLGAEKQFIINIPWMEHPKVIAARGGKK